jgi:hypothetical protein
VPAPVVFGPPVLDESLQIIEIGAILPARVAEVTREAGAAEAILEIRERRLGYSDFKRLFGWHWRSSDWLKASELADDSPDRKRSQTRPGVRFGFWAARDAINGEPIH